MQARNAPIGIFDSGFGGLTVMKDIIQLLPDYDYLYLGDNARAPYGTRSFETIYENTLQCVQYLLNRSCPLIILACNTASAEALRNIQKKFLPTLGTNQRVLGVIRPTAEVIGHHSKSGHVGILGTPATVSSKSYTMEIAEQFPNLHIYQQACPMWVPLVENGEYQHPGADYFVKQGIDQIKQKSPEIDVLLLACTHFPLLLPKIKAQVSHEMTILSQGPIVAASLADYLQRHPEIAQKCGRNSQRTYLTTDSPKDFNKHTKIFFGRKVQSSHVEISSMKNGQRFRN